LGPYTVEYYAQSCDERLLGRSAVIAGVGVVFSKGSTIATRAPRQTPAAVVAQVAANHQKARFKILDEQAVHFPDNELHVPAEGQIMTLNDPPSYHG
jgi:hypothetical protein